MILFERRKYISAKEEDATIELKIAAIRQGQSKQQATLNTKQLLFFWAWIEWNWNSAAKLELLLFKSSTAENHTAFQK